MPDPTANDGAVITENTIQQANAAPVPRQQGGETDMVAVEPNNAVLLPIGDVSPPADPPPDGEVTP